MAAVVDATEIAEDTRIYIQKCLENIEKGTEYDLGMCFESQWVGSIGLNSISKTNYDKQEGRHRLLARSKIRRQGIDDQSRPGAHQAFVYRDGLESSDDHGGCPKYEEPSYS